MRCGISTGSARIADGNLEVGIGEITTFKEMLSTQFSICFMLALSGIFLLTGLISIRRKDLH